MIGKRALGRTGFQVSEVGLGAWAIGGRSYGSVTEADAEGAVEAYVVAGGNFIDTARGYGTSEETLGRVIRRLGVRDRLILASKTGMTRSAEQLPRIREECELSLRLLQTDVIDLYYIHSPPEDPALMARVLEEFEALKSEGKIRSIGASIKGPDVTDDTVELCRRYADSGRIDAIQLIYSVLRQKNRRSIDHARSRNVGIVARTALENGFLTGKYAPGSVFVEGDHRRRWRGERLDRILREAETAAVWAVRPPYRDLAQVALRFALAAEGVSTIIPGARSADQVRRNVVELPPLEPSILARLTDRYGDFTPNANTGE